MEKCIINKTLSTFDTTGFPKNGYIRLVVEPNSEKLMRFGANGSKVYCVNCKGYHEYQWDHTYWYEYTISHQNFDTYHFINESNKPAYVYVEKIPLIRLDCVDMVPDDFSMLGLTSLNVFMSKNIEFDLNIDNIKYYLNEDTITVIRLGDGQHQMRQIQGDINNLPQQPEQLTEFTLAGADKITGDISIFSACAVLNTLGLYDCTNITGNITELATALVPIRENGSTLRILPRNTNIVLSDSDDTNYNIVYITFDTVVPGGFIISAQE